MPYSALNGKLPDSALQHLGWPEEAGERLRPDAADSIDRLAAAFEAHFHTPLRITDSYRTFAGQVAVHITKPNASATPGTSNHGLGLALDLASGINVDGSETHRWFEANAPAYGWINPSWAQDFNPRNGAHEPWHWEYHPELNTHAGAAGAATAAVPTPIAPTRRKTMRIIQAIGQPKVYITNGVTKRHILNGSELPDLLRLCEQTEPVILGEFTVDRIPNYAP